MKIGIIDADLIGRKKHRFPNLACMKLSSYYKKQGNDVSLLLNYNEIDRYDHVYMSKVFTDTEVPGKVLTDTKVTYGGTGFFYDKAIPLDYEIEHSMPDYHLYDEWQQIMIEQGVKKKDLIYYNDYSIGFTTRGCFRKCEFCVNKKYNKVEKHSELSEFIDMDKKYVCLLDDNILGYKSAKSIIKELNLLGKPFQFKQGMDIRLMTEELANMFNSCKYKGEYIFAFDNIEDSEKIIEKLTTWRMFCWKETKLYVFCGFDRNEKYSESFWKQDIVDTFKRIRILMSFECIPYIMRFNKYEESPYRGTYINLARWCNQPSFFKKKSYREFCIANGEKSAAMRYLKKFETDTPEIAKMYYDIKYSDFAKPETALISHS